MQWCHWCSPAAHGCQHTGLLPSPCLSALPHSRAWRLLVLRMEHCMPCYNTSRSHPQALDDPMGCCMDVLLLRKRRSGLLLAGCVACILCLLASLCQACSAQHAGQSTSSKAPDFVVMQHSQPWHSGLALTSCNVCLLIASAARCGTSCTHTSGAMYMYAGLLGCGCWQLCALNWHRHCSSWAHSVSSACSLSSFAPRRRARPQPPPADEWHRPAG